MDVILETNPFPNMQGMVCDHLCQNKCTRMNYDHPLLIREIKRFIAWNQTAGEAPIPAAPNGIKVAIIGAGPSGLSCAYFLALQGFEVEIFEKKRLPEAGPRMPFPPSGWTMRAFEKTSMPFYLWASPFIMGLQ